MQPNKSCDPWMDQDGNLKHTGLVLWFSEHFWTIVPFIKCFVEKSKWSVYGWSIFTDSSNDYCVMITEWGACSSIFQKKRREPAEGLEWGHKQLPGARAISQVVAISLHLHASHLLPTVPTHGPGTENKSQTSESIWRLRTKLWPDSPAGQLHPGISCISLILFVPQQLNNALYTVSLSPFCTVGIITIIITIVRIYITLSMCQVALYRY